MMETTGAHFLPGDIEKTGSTADVARGEVMRIIGIDPGSHNTGWGIVEVEGTRFRRVASGTMSPKASGLGGRLLGISDGLECILQEHHPTESAVESVFYSKNAQSALKLGHARGVVFAGLARAGLEIGEYSPTQVKQTLTGTGRAAKEQVAKMVRLLLGYSEKMGLDESDALAIAICHGQFYGSAATKMIEAAKRGKRA